MSQPCSLLRARRLDRGVFFLPSGASQPPVTPTPTACTPAPTEWGCAAARTSAERATGVPRRQPLQSEPLVPLSVGSRSSENGKQQTRWGNRGSPRSPRAERCCGQRSRFTRGPCPLPRSLPPELREQESAPKPAPRCAHPEHSAVGLSLAVALGSGLLHPGHSLCQSPSSAF